MANPMGTPEFKTHIVILWAILIITVLSLGTHHYIAEASLILGLVEVVVIVVRVWVINRG